MSRAADTLEQDVGGGEGDSLPTYENLAQAHGPNSRFGRWKGWVEKRAAERYADITPDELERRRRRGWGEGTADVPVPQDGPSTTSTSGPSSTAPLQLRTDFDHDTLPPIQPDGIPSPPIQPDAILEYDPSQPVVGESLRPAHLGLHQLGSRFLPHTTSPIRALLPLLGDRFLLIGHDDGLSVLNMFPQEWSDAGLQTRGPGEATAHPIWTGAGVFQMSLLEVEDIGESTPQGVALFLVGCEPENGKEQESMRILRMYNLASLISLAKWAISRKGAAPLNLHRSPGWRPHRSALKKHRASNNLAKGLKSLVFDPPQEPEPQSSYQSVLQASPGSSRRANSMRPIPERSSSSSLDSSWDVVDDLPLRWAADYVPLAVPGSRLMHTSVFTYALWRNDAQPRSSTLLAVGIKSAVLLYESPKGERAFRFIKEFYTPLHPRGITFVHQSLQENLSRSVSDATGALRTSSQPHGRASRHSMRQRPSTFATTVLNPQLSLFVVFEKKVGVIRIVNSAVGEVAFFEDPTTLTTRDSLSPSAGSFSASSSTQTASGLSSLPGRRSRTSLDGFGLARDNNRGAWALPAKLDLPDPDSTPASATTLGPWDTEPQPKSIYLVTRGKQSFALRCPLPANMHATVPLLTFHWRSPPSFVMPRVVDIEYGGNPGSAGGEDRSISEYSQSSTIVVPQRCRMLQLTAFNEDGLEIQEIMLSSLCRTERSRVVVEEGVPVVSSEVVLGETGFLTRGGHWDRPYDAPVDLSRSYSVRSGVSLNTMATEEVVSRLESNQGTYGWQRKGLEDWRVFWIGGIGDTDNDRTDY